MVRFREAYAVEMKRVFIVGNILDWHVVEGYRAVHWMELRVSRVVHLGGEEANKVTLGWVTHQV
jgi:hypothetical protein